MCWWTLRSSAFDWWQQPTKQDKCTAVTCLTNTWFRRAPRTHLLDVRTYECTYVSKSMLWSLCSRPLHACLLVSSIKVVCLNLLSVECASQIVSPWRPVSYFTWCISSTAMHSVTTKYGSEVETMSVRDEERVSASSFSRAVSMSWWRRRDGKEEETRTYNVESCFLSDIGEMAHGR